MFSDALMWLINKSAAYVANRSRALESHEIITKVVSRHTGVPVVDIRSDCRKREIAEARFMAVWFTDHYEPRMNDRQIAEKFKRDRTIVIYAKNKVNDLLDIDKKFKRTFEKIAHELKRTKL